MKLSKTAIRELTKMYRAVLMGAFIASAFITNGAHATANAITNLGTYDPSSGYPNPTTTTVLTASDIETGNQNGRIKVNGTDVAVKGLGSAAYTNSNAYDAAGAAEAVAISLTNHTVDADFNSISTNLGNGPQGGPIYGTADLGDTTVKSISTYQYTGSLDENDDPIKEYGSAELGDTSVYGTLQIGEANAIQGKDSEETGKFLDMGGNAVKNVQGLTLTNGKTGENLKQAQLTVTDSGVVSTNSHGITTARSDNTNYGAADLGDTIIHSADGTKSSTLSATEFGLKVNDNTEVDGVLKVGSTIDASGNIMTAQGTISGKKVSASEGILSSGDLEAKGNVTLGYDATKTITVKGTTTFKENVTIDSGKSLQLGGTSGNTVNAIDNGTTAQTSDGTTTMATVATVLKSAENATYDGTKTNVKSTTTTVKGAIQDLDSKIGTVTTSTNGVMNNQTVGQNIDALNNKMGNVAELGTYSGAKGNLTNGGTSTPTTIVKALENIDQSMGKIHKLVKSDGSVDSTKTGASTTGTHSNLAKGTTVEDHLISLDNAIGNRTLTSTNGAINTAMATTSLSAGLQAAGNQIGSLNYTSTKYVHAGDDLTTAVSNLDNSLSQMDTRMSSTEKKVEKMNKQMKSGFASMAALNGLKPNARACNDTQIAIGAGNYRGVTGFALGGFHYVNDNLMLNIGAGYAGNQSTTVSGGLTFGW